MVLVSPLLAREFAEENGEIRGEEMTCETIDIMIGGGLRGWVSIYSCLYRYFLICE